MADKTYSTPEQIEEDQGTAKSRFTKLDSGRSTVLDRARECSALTIPSVVVADGHTEDDDLESPYQSLGSRLVHSLASKLLLALLPPNTSFFRLMPKPEVVELAKQQEVNADLDRALVQLEQDLMKQVEREALRVPVFEAIKSLIIGGNSLLRRVPTGLKAYRMHSYVVSRDFSGNVKEVIARESVDRNTLDEELRNLLSSNGNSESSTTPVTLFNRAILLNGQWYEYQTLNDIIVPDSLEILGEGEPTTFIPLRWTSINGESYGRGLVEQYLGDFRTVEALRQLFLEGSAAQSKIVFGVKSGSTLEIVDLQEAGMGDVIEGDLENDVTVLRVDKASDFSLALQLSQDITTALEQAFLAASSAARDSERTTATEIRYMAADLEKSLGGVYSILSLELQRPLASMLIKASGADIKSLGVDIAIVTGIEALGRNVELDKLRQLNGMMQELGDPQLLLSRMNIGEYIKRIINAIALDETGLIKTEEQLKQEQQAAQQQAMLQQGGEAAAQAVGQQIPKMMGGE